MKTPSPKEVETSIQQALAQEDPQSLALLAELPFEARRSLRDSLREFSLTEEMRTQIVQWVWHDDPKIREAARALVLLLINDELTISCLKMFVSNPDLSPPFEIDYNFAEKEFHLDLPRTPGFCVCHYGRDNPRIDALLHALERVYCKMHPPSAGTVGFRR